VRFTPYQIAMAKKIRESHHHLTMMERRQQAYEAELARQQTEMRHRNRVRVMLAQARNTHWCKERVKAYFAKLNAAQLPVAMP